MSAVDIHLGDNLDVLPTLKSGTFALIYIDPPFNTGKQMAAHRIRAERDDDGVVGFGGRRYKKVRVGSLSFGDAFDDYLAFIEPRVLQARRLLTDQGSLFVHLDPRESHYVKVLCDAVFGRASFMG